MTGLIYVGIIAVWAVVLVPAWLRRHDHRDPERSVDRFSKSLQALAQRDTLLGIKLPGVSESDDDRDLAATSSQGSAAATGFEATRVLRVPRSEGATGDRARPRARPAARRAAARRRLVLGVLTGVLVVVAGLVVAGVLLPIAVAVPSALLGAFVVTARSQVRAARQARAARGRTATVHRSAAARPSGGSTGAAAAPTWEARPTTLPTYVTAPRAAEFPRVIDTTTPGAWTAAAMLERAQQQKARAERMAEARAEAIARAKAEQEAAEARSRDEEFLDREAATWDAAHTTAPIFPPRVVNE